MKSTICLITALFFLISISACNKSKKDIETEYISTKIKDYKIDRTKKFLVVLPGLGCKGCIQEGEQFMKDNVSNNNILFVLTKVESLKLLQQKIGVVLKDHPNVVVDKDNGFDIPTQNGVYPLIIELNNQEMKNYTFQSPENSMAFNKLNDRLKVK